MIFVDTGSWIAREAFAFDQHFPTMGINLRR